MNKIIDMGKDNIIIEACLLNKCYKVIQKNPGLLGSLKSLFSRKYITINAVCDFSLEVIEGQILGLIGGNGSGKSTIIKLLTGILKPDSGEVRLFNKYSTIDKNIINKEIGVLFGQRTNLNWDLPVIDSLTIQSYIYNVPKEVFQKRLKFILEYFNIEFLVNKPLRSLSLGQRMLCEFVAIYIHLPKIVFLDEPTIGLDIRIKTKIREFIKLWNETYNTTFIITSHDMGDIELLCSDIILIDKGKIIFGGKLNQLIESVFGFSKIKLTTEYPFDKINLTFSDDVKIIRKDSFSFDVIYPVSKIRTIDIMEELLKIPNLSDIKIGSPNLEFIINKIYQEKNEKIH